MIQQTWRYLLIWFAVSLARVLLCVKFIIFAQAAYTIWLIAPDMPANLPSLPLWAIPAAFVNGGIHDILYFYLGFCHEWGLKGKWGIK